MSISKVVYKYPIDIDTQVTLPAGKVVYIAPSESGKYHEIRVWVEHLVNEHGEILPYEGTDKLKLVVYGTGYPVQLKSVHRGSIISGLFVWHLYEVI